MEKVLYAINDFNLPFPVTFTQITWFVITEFIIILFGDILPLSMIEGAFLKYFGIPVALTWFMSQKTFVGKDINAFTTTDKAKLGVVLSDANFSEYLKIKDLIPILQNMYSKFNTSFFINQVKKFKLPLNKPIKTFSTGMKVKLKVLMAISHDASLLLLDEPTAGLDVIARDELLEMLREFMAKDEHRAILISSHISSDLESLCDDLYMIHNGRIMLHEETDVLLSDYALLKVDQETFNKLDHQYILRFKKEYYGYSCLTNQKQYYLENYPQVAIENGTIDDVITMMVKGE